MEGLTPKRLAENFSTFRFLGDVEHMQETANDPNFDPNFYTDFEEPLLHTLIYMGDDSKEDTNNLLAALEILNKHPRFDINAVDSFNESALMLCVRNKNLNEISKALIANKNIDLSIESNIGLNVFKLVNTYHNEELMEILNNIKNISEETPGIPHLRRSVKAS